MAHKAKAIPQTKTVEATPIRCMKRGQIAYTTPWAFDHEESAVYTNHYTYKSPGGTAEMKIRCIDPMKLYHVWPSEIKEQCCAPAVTRQRPQKTCLIKFQKDTDRSLYVWTDLIPLQIREIQGVTQVTMLTTGGLHVCIDARYDIRDIQAAIRELAAREDNR